MNGCMQGVQFIVFTFSFLDCAGEKLIIHSLNIEYVHVMKMSGTTCRYRLACLSVYLSIHPLAIHLHLLFVYIRTPLSSLLYAQLQCSLEKEESTKFFFFLEMSLLLL